MRLIDEENQVTHIVTPRSFLVSPGSVHQCNWLGLLMALVYKTACRNEFGRAEVGIDIQLREFGLHVVVL